MNNDKRKIAVQFFGHLRTYEKCAISVKKYLLDEYDCDVFIHTWNKTESSTLSCHDMCKINDVDADVINNLRDLYNPKLISIEEQDFNLYNDSLIPCQHNSGIKVISSRGMKFMLHSKIKVNELRKNYQRDNNIKYDYVVMIRPDIELYKKFILDESIREIELLGLKQGRYCAVNCINNKEFPIIGGLATDILYFASPNIMDKIMEVFQYIDFTLIGENGFYNPETYFVLELQKRGIESYFLGYKYKESWDIVRSKNGRTAFKDFLKVKVNRKIFLVSFLECLNMNIVNMELYLFNRFKLLFRIGNEVKYID